MNHPRENDLALLAGGEAGHVRHFLLDRHVRACAPCATKLAEYREMRSELADVDLPDLNWNFLASDMRANIRLGLEAGACVRATRGLNRWNSRMILAFASLLVLVGSTFVVRETHPMSWRSNPVLIDAATPILQWTESGVEIRSGMNSLMLLNHRGNPGNQTVSAQGRIGERYVDGETGSVTINNVYLQ